MKKKIVMMEDCKIMRRKKIRKYDWNMVTGEHANIRETWVEEPCGTPIFGGNGCVSGVCRTCLSGWSVEGNSPMDTPENAALFESARKELANKNQ